MDRNIALSSGECRLELSATDGRLRSFCFRGEELLRESDALFTLGIRDAARELHIVSASDFARVQYKYVQGENRLTLQYEAHPQWPSFRCRVHLRTLHNAFLWRFEVAGQGDGRLLEWVDGPQVVVRGDLAGRPGGEGHVFQGMHEGILIDNPRLREECHGGGFAYRLMGWPNNGANGYYPGCAQMQFLAYYNDRAGLYFGAHDPAHGTKAVEVASLDEARCRLSLQTFCGRQGEDGTYLTPFEFVLAGFKGDWMDAADIYRNWTQTAGGLPPRLLDNPLVPKWFDHSPLMLFIPVRGDGDDKGAMRPNEYFPYVRIMETVRRYARAVGGPVMVVLMHWEGTAPWAPPYVWPPYGGVEALAELRDALHAEGHLLGVYCSGTAWTQTSSIVSYSQEEKCDRENLRAEMARGPKGQLEALICNGPPGVGQRMGFDCCVFRRWTQETVAAEIMKLADFGLDYAQFFDQNLGGSSHFCHAADHGHPKVPGPWQTEAMQTLCRQVEAKLAQHGSQMLIGCEAAAAHPYIKYMQFNDLRNTNALWLGSRPVPAYAYVFHEHVNNFMGNQNGLTMSLDMDAAPDNLLWRIAYAFVAGDMLAATLKDGGRIAWCWVMKWHLSEPSQEPLVTLLRNLGQWRRGAGKPWLVYGRMRRPFAAVTAAPYELPLRIMPQPLQLDGVLTSAWTAPDDTDAQFLVNFRPEPQTVRLRLPDGGTAQLLAQDGSTASLSGETELALPPLSAVRLTL